MTDNIITVVAGLGRCGSSLVMRMLKAGGMELFHDPGMEVSCETGLIYTLPKNHAWLAQCQGKALKLLDPHKNPPSPSFDYRFIWLDREEGEQAKSQLKFQQACGARIDTSRQSVRRISASLRQEARAAIGICRAFGPTYRMRFENLIRNPYLSACDIASFVERDLDQQGMARQVVQRSSKCLPYMLEFSQVTP